jgi:hypothetical protein
MRRREVPTMSGLVNRDVAGRLEELGRLLHGQDEAAGQNTPDSHAA